MWLLKFHILLLAINLIQSSKHSSFPIDELYHQLSSIPSLVCNLHLEAQLVNGNVTPMALINELLGRQLEEKMFEEYSQMDISSGIKEQNDLLDLVDKAEKLKTSEEVRKDVGDGLEVLDEIKDMKPISEETRRKVDEELKKIEDFLGITNNDYGNIKYIIQSAHFIMGSLQRSLNELRLKIQSAGFPLPDAILKHSKLFLENIVFDFNMISNHTSRLSKTFESVGFRPELLSIDPEASLKIAIQEGKTKVSELVKVSNLSQKISSIKEELKVLEELRDAPTVKDLVSFLDRLEGFELAYQLSPSVLDKYKDIRTASKILEKVTEFVSRMDEIDWKVTVFKKRWKPLKTHLMGLNLGDYTGHLTSIESCLAHFAFTPNFTREEQELTNPVKPLNEHLAPLRELWDWMMKYADTTAIRKELEDWMRRDNYGIESLNRLLKIIGEIDKDGLNKTVAMLEQLGSRTGNPMEKMLNETFDELRAVRTGTIRIVTKSVVNKISEIEHFLKCYSDLKVVPSDVKTLMDKPKEVWNFDARPLERAVEVVSLFKGAHKMIGELANWKFEHNPLFKNFPLDSEDVKGINEGFGALEAIRNVQNGYDRMVRWESSEILKSVVKTTWHYLKFFLKNFSEELSHLKSHTRLPELQKFISNVRFPDNLQFDTIIDFFKTKYRGPRRTEIVKYLEFLKQFQMDYPGYSSKLEKMNEAIGKMNKWLEDQKQGVVDEEEEPYVDCAVSPCDKDITLLAPTPEDPRS